MILSKELPAGNIQVLAAGGNRAMLDVEMRDSSGRWFYWKFKACFSEPGRYEFCFSEANKVGTRSAAVSFDRGRSWSWLSDELHADSSSFSFECREPGEVWFCQAIPYLQEEFNRFAREFDRHRAFRVTTLCRSRRGRGVELVTVREEEEPEHVVLLTSRHHAQEMMATHALEGILRAVLADDEFGRMFRRRIALFAVPFVDKDGVEEGDQGKNRKPFDHGRDYAADHFIYPETSAIRTLVDRQNFDFALDMHCPWIRGGNDNEELYMVHGASKEGSRRIEAFGRILEEEAPACAPYSRRNNILFGTGWNTPDNYKDGAGLKHYGNQNGRIRFAQTLEIPFANIGKRTFTREGALQLGGALARSIFRYLESGV